MGWNGTDEEASEEVRSTPERTQALKRKKSQLPTLRGLKSAQRIMNKRLVGTTEVVP
jgi:hypothetical protein